MTGTFPEHYRFVMDAAQSREISEANAKIQMTPPRVRFNFPHGHLQKPDL
jgi:hypothetical protein